MERSEFTAILDNLRGELEAARRASESAESTLRINNAIELLQEAENAFPLVALATARTRDECAKAVCEGCRLGCPTFIENGGEVWHEMRRSIGRSMDYPCRAAAIRAFGPK